MLSSEIQAATHWLPSHPPRVRLQPEPRDVRTGKGCGFSLPVFPKRSLPPPRGAGRPRLHKDQLCLSFCLFRFASVTALLRCDSQNIQFTPLKRTIQCFLVQSYTTDATIKFRTFPLSCQEAHAFISLPFPPPASPQPQDTAHLPISVEMPSVTYLF